MAIRNWFGREGAWKYLDFRPDRPDRMGDYEEHLCLA